MGLHEARSQQVLELPGPLTLSFLTYASDLTTWAARARTAGHEVLAHIPMQPLDAAHDSGPGTLHVAMNAAEVRAQVAAGLDAGAATWERITTWAAAFARIARSWMR